MGLAVAAMLIEWVVSAWEWLFGPSGSRLGGMVVTAVILGFANGTRLDRRAESYKQVLAAQVLHLYEREVSDLPADEGVTVANNLHPAPLPHVSWDRWERFRRRWLQTKHLPWRVKHHGSALLFWCGRHTLNVVLTWASAPSRHEAMNQMLALHGRAEISSEEFKRIDRPGAVIVWPLDHHGYLVLEPPRPRRRWRRQRRTAANAPPPPAEHAMGATPPPEDETHGYCRVEERERGARNDQTSQK